MNVGMLWFDNDPKRAFAEKVRRAAEHYARKYGRAPNRCIVHVATEDAGDVDGIRVQTSKSVLPHHFWLGVGET